MRNGIFEGELFELFVSHIFLLVAQIEIFICVPLTSTWQSSHRPRHANDVGGTSPHAKVADGNRGTRKLEAGALHSKPFHILNVKYTYMCVCKKDDAISLEFQRIMALDVL